MRVYPVGVELACYLQEGPLGLLRGHALDAAAAARRTLHRLSMQLLANRQLLSRTVTVRQ